MAEKITIRVVVEEVVVDFVGEVGGAYKDQEIRDYIKDCVESALRLHEARKPKLAGEWSR